jgi:hypothetical protein
MENLFGRGRKKLAGRAVALMVRAPGLRFGAAAFAFTAFKRRLVGWRGLEPRTNALKGQCSTN